MTDFLYILCKYLHTSYLHFTAGLQPDDVQEMSREEQQRLLLEVDKVVQGYERLQETFNSSGITVFTLLPMTCLIQFLNHLCNWRKQCIPCQTKSFKHYISHSRKYLSHNQRTHNQGKQGKWWNTIPCRDKSGNKKKGTIQGISPGRPKSMKTLDVNI
jgi:hypothetical protein